MSHLPVGFVSVFEYCKLNMTGNFFLNYMSPLYYEPCGFKGW